MPWHPDIIKYFVNEDGNIQFGNSPSIPWSKLDRWNYTTSTPPPYTFYTVFSLDHTLYIFCGILCFHAMVIYLVKLKWSYAFLDLNFLEHIIHTFENTNIPYNIQQWDSPIGDATAHKIRMESNLKEGLSLILTSCIFSCLHLLPLYILGIKYIIQFCVIIILTVFSLNGMVNKNA